MQPVLVWTATLKKRVGEVKYNELKRASDSLIFMVIENVFGSRLSGLGF